MIYLYIVNCCKILSLRQKIPKLLKVAQIRCIDVYT